MITVFIPRKSGVIKLDAVDYFKIKKDGWSFTISKKHNVSPPYLVAMITKRINGRSKHRSLAREILNLNGDLVADHISRETLNNKRSNLRATTRLQNSQNLMTKTGSSKYKGVTYKKEKRHKANPWVAYININKERKHLGVFKNEVDAASAYNAAALKNFGEYAYLNEIAP